MTLKTEVSSGYAPLSRERQPGTVLTLCLAWHWVIHDLATTTHRVIRDPPMATAKSL